MAYGSWLSFGAYKDGKIKSSDEIFDLPTYDPYYLHNGYATWTELKFHNPTVSIVAVMGGLNNEAMWGHLGDPIKRNRIATNLVSLLFTKFPVYLKNLDPQDMKVYIYIYIYICMFMNVYMYVCKVCI